MPKDKEKDRDEPVKIELDPEDALRALLKAGPHSETVEDSAPLQGARARD